VAGYKDEIVYEHHTLGPPVVWGFFFIGFRQFPSNQSAWEGGKQISWAGLPIMFQVKKEMPGHTIKGTL
jgi:hypothetical protein